MCCRGEIDLEAIDKDKQINKQLQNDKIRINDKMKLLLLGSGESGKSTILKQMKILHLGGFNPEERNDHTVLIHSNIYESVQNIVIAAHQFHIELSPESIELGKEFLEPFAKLLSSDLGNRIAEFWRDPGVQKVFSRNTDFQILDNTSYYVANIQRICDKDYVPNELDILHSRCKTTGVTETVFFSQGKKFVMVDVGGQRSERKKWIHCFENVIGVLFCVGISAFDQTLHEDNVTNRLHEDLKLFHDICISKWFTTTAIILFLNKADLFKEKLAQGKSLSEVFPEFTGGTKYSVSVNFLKEKFVDINDPATGRKKNIYCHITTATDTDNIKHVFDDVRDYLTNDIFTKAGLILN